MIKMDAKPYKIPHPFRKLKKELIDAIVKDIEQGSPHIYAAEANGITESIFNVWRKQGKIDIDHENYDSLPAYLVVSLARIKKKEIMECRQMIRANDKGHKGAEWTLEHAYWRHFGPNAAIIEFNKRLEELEGKKVSDKESENGSQA